MKQYLPWSAQLDAVRLAALHNLVFTMGIGRLLGFKKTLPALRDGRWADAEAELLDSRYVGQVPSRADRIA